uniref:Nucleotide-binding alpha-beta plait domain-containing protein n=1 Tax=Tanacetum cinerariifolium TaxID=118510 RepID=A0A699KAU3_TANCI|nr:nucleotide-binding alpha-beta plait domain-containing protein [Tanacetum cinerariifolium]
MGFYKSKEDDVTRISTSVFVTNFPEAISAKELFNVCKQYGHVVDSFISSKGSKAGKRFAFVRFINVFSIGNKGGQNAKDFGDNVSMKQNETRGRDSSYVIVLKSQEQKGGLEEEVTPALVLGEECLTSKDISNCLVGRVKEFASLVNLKMVFCDEGFSEITIQYLGEFWVLMEFGNVNVIKSFLDNVSMNSWFSQVRKASVDFLTEGRIAWVEVEGIPFKVFWIRASEVPGWVPDFRNDEEDEEQSVDVVNGGGETRHGSDGGDNNEVDEVFATVVKEEEQEVKHCEEVNGENAENISEDLFNIYPLLNKNQVNDKRTGGSESMSHPPGYSPPAGSEVNEINKAGDTVISDKELTGENLEGELKKKLW